eukprot:TRINITY_DN78983_c0_g1_i1.p2 TRINITY_DN78983_c0_g1~~TRINITY_DN78983_c0_g1_i1.p2  ORF type:complete len:100 (-),score=10.04 TRINITY_DN78983_c0_g1_i1:533-832(-)
MKHQIINYKLKIYQKISIQEKNGVIVNLLKKLEINLLVVLVGLSVLPQLCLIEYVLLLDRKIREEFHQKTLWNVVIIVVMVVMVVIYINLGIIGKREVL